MRDLVFTLVFFGVVLPALTRPWLGIVIWCWMDYMNPHRLCYGFAKYAIPFSQISAGVTVGSALIIQEPRRFPWTRETVLLICFVLWMNVTVWFALNPYAAWTEWDRVMKIQVMVFATLFLMYDRWRLEALVWIIVLSLGFYGVKGGVFTLMTGGAHRVHGPEYTYIEDNNDLALALVSIIPLMRYLQLKTESKFIRIGLGIAMFFTTISILGSYSRAGFIALATVSFLMFLKSRKKVVFGFMLVAAIGIGLAIMPQQWFDRMNTIKSYEQDNSARGRFNAWEFAWNVAMDHPITGGGFRVFTKELFQIYAPDPEDYHEAHNIFFKVLGEHGFPGVFLFASLFASAWFSASWVKQQVRSFPHLMWAGDLAGMMQVSLAGFTLGGSFLNLAYFALPYHLVAIILICKVIVKEEIAAAADVSTVAEPLAEDPQAA